jgi:endonuclease/exonuclease/phosphatase family metal-dependent hydrolase
MATTFATMNLYQFAEPPVAWYDQDNVYTDTQWQDKKQWITDQLASVNADVVGFQEVFSVDALRALAAAAGYSEFAVVDQPKEKDDAPNVHYSPVVALASKHPIKNAQAVAVAAHLLPHLPITQDFKFSRQNIRALVTLPELGDTTVYVAHLKSKRADQPNTATSVPMTVTDAVFNAAVGTSLGQSSSMIQRTVETSMLYNDVINQIRKDPNAPVIVMGDMNDTAHSVAIDALTNQNAHYDLDGAWSDEHKLAIYQSRLYDAYSLTPNQQGGQRPSTHFHKGNGHVVDFIFVSNALNSENPASIARPIKYKVTNGHLKADGVGDQQQSDHGVVALTLMKS